MKPFHFCSVFILVCFFASASMSQESADPTGNVEIEVYQDSQAPGDVFIENQADFSAPYKQRRSKHGVLFSVGTEKYYPKNFVSVLDNTGIEKILKNQPINLFTIDIGYKYNFGLGSLAFSYAYASGSGTGGFNNESRDISFQRQSLLAGYYADNIFNEPWVVPYGSAGISQFTLDEEEYNPTGTLADDSVVTDPILNLKAGLLFQLNWIESGIDSNTHVDGLRSSGLENTFLDIHISWFEHLTETFDINNPVETAENDPDLSAEAQLGVGLKLEF